MEIATVFIRSDAYFPTTFSVHLAGRGTCRVWLNINDAAKFIIISTNLESIPVTFGREFGYVKTQELAQEIDFIKSNKIREFGRNTKL